MKTLLAFSLFIALAASAQTVTRPAPPTAGPIRSAVILAPRTATAAHQVTLTCTSSASSGVTSYNFYRSLTQTGGFSNIGNNSTCNFADTIVTAKTTYFYYATAMDPNATVQESVPSNTVQVTVPGDAQPIAPTNLTGTAQ